MADLITLARAKQAIGWPASFSSAEDACLASLITGVSRAVESYTRCQFGTTNFDELYAGTPSTRLVLRQRPVASVTRVAYGPTAVLRIRNTRPSAARAFASVSAGTLDLACSVGGVMITDTLSLAANATLTLLAAAINTAPINTTHGWSAAVDAAFGDWASADLRGPQGALNAKGVDASLGLHVHEISDYSINAERGWLDRGGAVSPNVGAFDGEPPGWEGGEGYWRIQYTRGAVPEDVQEACAQWTAALFGQTKRDPGLILNETTGVGTTVAWVNRRGVPEHVKALLGPHRRFPI